MRGGARESKPRRGVLSVTLAGACRARASPAASFAVAVEEFAAASSALSSWTHTSQDSSICWATWSNWCAAEDSCNQPVEINASHNVPRHRFAFAKLLFCCSTSHRPVTRQQNYRQVLGLRQWLFVPSTRQNEKGTRKGALTHFDSGGPNRTVPTGLSRIRLK